MTRAEKIDALQAVGMSKFQARGISGDANLWCREFESGALDNPEAFWVPESLFDWTAPSEAIEVAADFSVTFERGVPVAIDGQCLPLLNLISRLNLQAGAFGVGRYSGLEHLEQGEKVLEVREAPAATVLMDAYRHLETATLAFELIREKMTQEQLWVREAIEGRWFGAVREAADGDRGCKLALAQSYDLLLLDLVLPGTSGLEILQAVRQARPTQAVIM